MSLEREGHKGNVPIILNETQNTELLAMGETILSNVKLDNPPQEGDTILISGHGSYRDEPAEIINFRKQPDGTYKLFIKVHKHL